MDKVLFDGDKKEMYVIFDSKAKFYKSPFVMRTKAEVLRGFSDVANDKQCAIGQHPEDYVLYHIANWYETSGVIENIVPVCLGKAIDFLKDAPALSVQS